jgi:hypothetical protein
MYVRLRCMCVYECLYSAADACAAVAAVGTGGTASSIVRSICVYLWHVHTHDACHNHAD